MMVTSKDRSLFSAFIQSTFSWVRNSASWVISYQWTGTAAGVSGDGCRRQGRHDQTCDERGEPPGLPGELLQGALRHRSGSRLPLACQSVPAGARADRHLQPQLLRGNPGGACAPRAARTADHS